MYIFIFSLIWLTVISLTGIAAWIDHWIAGAMDASSGTRANAGNPLDVPAMLG